MSAEQQEYNIEATEETRAAMRALTDACQKQTDAMPGADLKMWHCVVVMLPAGEDMGPSKNVSPSVLNTFGKNSMAMAAATSCMMDVTSRMAAAEQEGANVQH